MDSKNMKVSDIVKISGLPYSTVKAILERGAEKAGYINAVSYTHLAFTNCHSKQYMLLLKQS